MLTEKSKKIIQGEMLNLPKEAQEAINASNWEGVSEGIGKKYLLDDDEVETFQLETISFLLGFIDEDAYQEHIEDNVGTSKDEAEKISKEVFEKILTPVDNAIAGKIRRNYGNKNTNWQQNLDFIMSGGDYSSFVQVSPPRLEKDGEKEPAPLQMPAMRRVPIISSPLATTPTLADIKANIAPVVKQNPPQEKETPIPMKPKL